MISEEFEAVIAKRVDKCMSLLGSKGMRYAQSDDKLHNFRVAARLEHTTLTKALTGMMTKHTVKLHDMLATSDSVQYSPDDWDEVVGDMINYLLLLTAVLEEEYGTQPAAVIPNDTRIALDVPQWASKFWSTSPYTK